MRDPSHLLSSNSAERECVGEATPEQPVRSVHEVQDDYLSLPYKYTWLAKTTLDERKDIHMRTKQLSYKQKDTEKPLTHILWR